MIFETGTPSKVEFYFLCLISSQVNTRESKQSVDRDSMWEPGLSMIPKNVYKARAAAASESAGIA